MLSVVVIDMVLSVHLSHCVIMSTKNDLRSCVSPNGSPNSLVFDNVKMLRKFKGYHPPPSAIFYFNNFLQVVVTSFWNSNSSGK